VSAKTECLGLDKSKHKIRDLNTSNNMILNQRLTISQGVKMNNQIYSKKTLELFRNPKNMGEIKNPDAVGTVGNPLCGDVMKIYLKIEKNKIKNIKFQTFGCAAAIATSSMVTELAKDKTLEQAKKITKEDVADALGKLPPIKMHCSNLAIDALRKAIKDYKNSSPSI